jgi:hypothetical protein
VLDTLFDNFFTHAHFTPLLAKTKFSKIENLVWLLGMSSIEKTSSKVKFQL